MIFTGKRQVGKTHEAISEVVNRCKDGDIVGVISYSSDVSKHLKRLIEKRLLVRGKENVKVEVIRLEDRGTVDHVLIDELDMLLGKNCVCATGGVVNLKGVGIDYPGTYSERITGITERLLASIDLSLPRPLNYDKLHVSKEKAKELHDCYCPEYDVVVEKDSINVIIKGEKYSLSDNLNSPKESVEWLCKMFDEDIVHSKIRLSHDILKIFYDALKKKEVKEN